MMCLKGPCTVEGKNAGLDVQLGSAISRVAFNMGGKKYHLLPAGFSGHGTGKRKCSENPTKRKIREERYKKMVWPKVGEHEQFRLTGTAKFLHYLELTAASL